MHGSAQKWIRMSNNGREGPTLLISRLIGLK
jgi:hypothetical protein